MPGQPIAPCVPINIPALPTLPAPFSFSLPSLPTLTIKANVCCLSLDLGNLIPPIPLPPLVVNPALVTTLRVAIAAVQAFLDNLPIHCPRQ